MKTHGGKGSTPRPVNKEQFDANWDRIFGGVKTTGVNVRKENAVQATLKELYTSGELSGNSEFKE